MLHEENGAVWRNTRSTRNRPRLNAATPKTKARAKAIRNQTKRLQRLEIRRMQGLYGFDSPALNPSSRTIRRARRNMRTCVPDLTEVIDLTSPQQESSQFTREIDDKLDLFFKRHYSISSDEEDHDAGSDIGIHENPSSASNNSSLPSTSNTINTNLNDFSNGVGPSRSFSRTQEQSFDNLMSETRELINDTSKMLQQLDKDLHMEETLEKPPEPVVVVDDDQPSPKMVKISCPVCLESLSRGPVASTICGHIFCESCIEQAAIQTKKCPICRKNVTLKKIHRVYLQATS